MNDRPSIHANCVVVGEAGVLIRGVSGAGKSRLSESLVDHAKRCGLHARLVADDRTLLSLRHGRLVARVPDTIAGLIERRGAGIARVDFLREAVLRLIVDLITSADQVSEDADAVATLENMRLPRLGLAAGDPDAPAAILSRLDLERRPGRCVRFALAFAPQHEKIAY